MLYQAGQILWELANPGTALLILIVGAAIAFAIRWRRLGGVALAAAVALAGSLALTPLDRWLLRPLETRFQRPADLPARVDGILVLGGGLSVRTAHERPLEGLNAAGDRLLAAAVLARRFPDAALVYASGAAWPPGNPVTEAAHAAELFAALEIADERIVLEDRSHNTRENALFAKRVAAPRAGQVWLLVTSGYHMPRAVGVLRRVGWPGLVPYPVDFKLAAHGGGGWLDGDLTGALVRADIAAKEYAGLLGYRLLGWTPEVFPAAKSSR